MTVYKVSYIELVKFNGNKEPESAGRVDWFNVLAEHAEEAIAKIRKRVVGKKREVKGIEDEVYRGKCADIVVQECQKGVSIDF